MTNAGGWHTVALDQEGEGPVEVRARVYGLVAVHRDPDDGVKTWGVTHIPTGSSFGHFDSQADATDFAKEVRGYVDGVPCADSTDREVVARALADRRVAIEAARSARGGWNRWGQS